MPEPIDALRVSVSRLREIVEPLDDDALTESAYPTEWTIADVLSHLGSAAAIMQRRLEDGLAGRDLPEEFSPGVWDEWNSKSPREQADDGLAADAALLARIEAVGDEEAKSFGFSLGPIEVDFGGLILLRVNEHAFHTWDIDVARNPHAVLPPELAAVVIDNLDLVARFTAKPTGDTKTIKVRTTEPARTFTIELTPDRAALTSDASPDDSAADLELPAESFARLVYGRLDDAQYAGNAIIATLKRVFPGV
jgi:uncharacterized protein (TIGR03083 family)